MKGMIDEAGIGDVTVTGVDDGDIDGNRLFTVALEPVNGSDPDDLSVVRGDHQH